MPPDAIRARAGQGGSAGTDTAHYALWKCTPCGFDYDEAAGLPDESFAPGARWSDIPEYWS